MTCTAWRGRARRRALAVGIVMLAVAVRCAARLASLSSVHPGSVITADAPALERPGDEPASRPRRRRREVVVGVTGVTGVLVAVALVAGWAAGWRTHIMTTASMGRAAPVGTLVVSRPVMPAAIRPGQIIVFHPPGQAGVTFAHRVIHVSRGADPAISTRGDLNGSVDPWTLHARDLIGRVVWRFPVVGYLIEMLPAALAAALAIILVTVGLDTERRRAARTLLGSLAAAGLLLYYRPLARLAVVAETVDHGRGLASVVPTGILPLRIRAVGGSDVDLIPGQLGSVHHGHIADHGRFALTVGLHLSGWWWLLLGVWAIPLLVGGWRLPDSIAARHSESTSAAVAEPTLRAASPSPRARFPPP